MGSGDLVPGSFLHSVQEVKNCLCHVFLPQGVLPEHMEHSNNSTQAEPPPPKKIFPLLQVVSFRYFSHSNQKVANMPVHTLCIRPIVSGIPPVCIVSDDHISNTLASQPFSFPINNLIPNIHLTQLQPSTSTVILGLVTEMTDSDSICTPRISLDLSPSMIGALGSASQPQ